MDAILDEATIRKRRERLGLMTSGLGLDGAYDATLDRIKGQGKGKAALGMAALMWISRSERPMHIGELCEALAIEIDSRDMDSENTPSKKTLLASCLGLVTVDESSIVRLVHFTLQEYFNRHSEHFKSPHAAMAEACLVYLNFDCVNKISHTLDSAPAETPFLQYASSYWGPYARNGLTEAVKSLALRLLGKFGRHISAKLLLWGNFNGWERERRYSAGFTGLHCAAYLGLDKVVIGLLKDVEGCGADMVDGWGRTPLMWAAESGHEGMVKLLLDRKEVNPDSKDKDGKTPLWGAAFGGHEGIAKLLLDRKEVNPDSRDDLDQTPLWGAAFGGHEGIVKLLLDRKEVNPNSRDDCGRAPLGRAAFGGHEGIVKLLLDRNEVNPDSRDDFGRTPLWVAASGGHEGVVKLLLDRKEVNPDSGDKHGKTPLQCAAEGGHETLLKLLQGHADAESGTGANDAAMPPSHISENSYEGLVVSPLPPQPPRAAPDMLTQNTGTHAALSSAVSPPDTPPDTPYTSSQVSTQAPPVYSPPLALPNPVPRTAIAVAGIATAAAILAITIRRWL